jgi:hypothetical protein
MTGETSRTFTGGLKCSNTSKFTSIARALRSVGVDFKKHDTLSKRLS